jgi:hypothetical protein
MTMTETDLRFRLRQLPREMDPERDLWPGIESRLQPAPRRHARAAWTGGLALAASLMLAAVGWYLGNLPTPANDAGSVAEAARSTEASMVEAQARAMTVEYEAALAEYAGATLPDEVEPDLEALDRGARDIRSALAASPDSVHLLQMLQRTYARRIELTHRAAIG